MQDNHQCYLQPLEVEELSDNTPLNIYFDYKTWSSPEVIKRTWS